MTPRPSDRSTRASGFTMLELLIVLFTASAVAALLLIGGKRAVARGQISRAHTELERIHNILLEYRLREGYYPASLTSLTGRFGAALQTNSQGLPIDPWKQSYCYTNDTLLPAEAYHLYSSGPDATTNTADDIREGQ